MVHGMVWKLEDNPTEIPFWIARGYDEKYLNTDNAEEFASRICSDMTWLARLYVDEVVPNAPFAFSAPKEPLPSGHTKYSQAIFELDTPHGPILCEYCWADKWGIVWGINACAIVSVVKETL